jgi:hypothetical protein
MKGRTIQMGTSLQGDEKLRAVGVWATVGHTQQSTVTAIFNMK